MYKGNCIDKVVQSYNFILVEHIEQETNCISYITAYQLKFKCIFAILC